MEVQFPQAPLGYCNVGVGLLLRIGFAMTLLSGGAIMYYSNMMYIPSHYAVPATLDCLSL